jgi:hypothetical protein
MSNCLIYALRQWYARGGYVVVRKSRFGWWPHFLWSPDLRRFESFVPQDAPKKRLFPPVLFRGFVLLGDDE